MPSHDLPAESMRRDWNSRAQEDAFYFVAFGRRNQSEEEFFDTGAEQVAVFEAELKRLPPARPRQRRALEIGCGPGRLMRGLAKHFGEIHGVDVSDEMVRLAREKLGGVPNAHPRHAPNSNLEAYADDSFDLVYSYAVFQHIPSREVVFGYLDEAFRVLKPGGVLRCQLSGLPQSAKQYDTWAGVRISATELREYSTARGWILLALEGEDTQYLWITMRKPPAPEFALRGPRAIRRISSAYNSSPAVPNRGRFAAISLWVQGLPSDADLNRLSIEVGSQPASLTFLGHPEPDSLIQLNALLPEHLGTGLQPVTLRLDGELLCDKSWMRLRPAGPPVPRVLSVTDGYDLLSPKIVTNIVKATVEEVDPNGLRITANGIDVSDVEQFCTDPRLPRYELNFALPTGIGEDAEIVFRSGRRVVGRTNVGVELISGAVPGPDGKMTER